MPLVIFFQTDSDVKHRLIVSLNGLEYHVYNRWKWIWFIMNSALHNLEKLKYNNLIYMYYTSKKKNKKKQGLIQVCKNFKKQVCTCDMYFITFFIYVLGHTYTINLKSFSELKDMEVSNWFWQKWPSVPFFDACKHYIMIIIKLLSSLRLHSPCYPTFNRPLWRCVLCM